MLWNALTLSSNLTQSLDTQLLGTGPEQGSLTKAGFSASIITKPVGMETKLCKVDCTVLQGLTMHQIATETKLVYQFCAYIAYILYIQSLTQLTTQ